VNQARTKKITPTPKKRAGQRAATHDANHSERTEAQTGVQTEAQMEAQTEAQAALEAALMDGFLEASQHPQASNAEGVLLETLSAALLAAGRPVKPKELTNLLGVPVEAVFRLLETLRRRFQEANLGFDLEAVAGGYRGAAPRADAGPTTVAGSLSGGTGDAGDYRLEATRDTWRDRVDAWRERGQHPGNLAGTRVDQGRGPQGGGR
jgi:hypothetical protein